MINRLLQGNMFLREEAGSGEGGGGDSTHVSTSTPTPGEGGFSRPSLAGDPSAEGQEEVMLSAGEASKQEAGLKDYLASPETLAAFREQMGIPGDAKEYGVSLPEGVELEPAVMGVLQKAGVDYGIAPGAMAGLVKDYLSAQSQAEEAARAEYESNLDTEFAAMQKEYGQDYDAKCAGAAQAAKTLCRMAGVDPAILTAPGIGDNPNLIRMFAKASELLSEGSAKGIMNKDMFSSTMDEARRIESDPTHPLHKAYMDVNDPMHAVADRAYNRAMGIS